LTNPARPGVLPRVGLVLAGGAVAGLAFHIGALNGLQRLLGWDPRTADLIVGTSSGSIIGTALRAGIGPAEMEQRVATFTHLRPDDFTIPDLLGGPAAPGLVLSELARGHRLRPSRLLAGLLPQGRTSTGVVREVVASLRPDGPWPEKPLWIIATEQVSGKRRVFGRPADEAVDLGLAIEASCAVPGYFTPALIDGVRHVDGGVHSPDNADLLADEPLDVVLVLSPLSIEPAGTRSPLAWKPLDWALRVYPRRRLNANLDTLHQRGIETLALQPDHTVSKVMSLNAMSTEQVGPVVEAADAMVERWLAGLDGKQEAVIRRLG